MRIDAFDWKFFYDLTKKNVKIAFKNAENGSRICKTTDYFPPISEIVSGVGCHAIQSSRWPSLHKTEIESDTT